MLDKISIEPLSKEHTGEIFELTELNRGYLREWLPWLDSVKTVSDTAAFIHSMEQQAQAGGGPHFAIFCDGAICGVAGFHKIDSQNRVGSIGYWLGQAYVGNGIVTHAVKRLLAIGFVELKLNKIEIRCAEGNIKSRAIPERLGFTCEATLRQCEWLYSKYVNHVVYSMLASEYEVSTARH